MRDLLVAATVLTLGLVLVRGRFPPAWVHGRALPRDPDAWRSTWVITGWLLVAAAAFVGARAFAL